VRLGPHELRACTTGARVQCLTVDDGTRLDLGELAADLLRSWPHADPLKSVLIGASELPAGSAAELVDLLRAALAEDLARARHELVRTAHDRRWKTRRMRLHALVHRLARYAPPAGRGAVGVDLEGRAIVLQGDGRTLRWGPIDGPKVEVLSRAGLHPTAARRLLRTRAAAAPSARLQGLVHGDEQFSERACRWIAAALTLRTVQMLLDVPA